MACRDIARLRELEAALTRRLRALEKCQAHIGAELSDVAGQIFEVEEQIERTEQTCTPA